MTRLQHTTTVSCILSTSLQGDFPFQIETIYPQTNEWSDVAVLNTSLAREDLLKHFPDANVEQVLETGEFPRTPDMSNKTFHSGLFAVVAENAEYKINIDEMYSKLKEAVEWLPPDLKDLSI